MKKAVLITGAGSGIGAATARRFSQSGWFVLLAGRTVDPMVQLAQELRFGASVLKIDLTNSASIKKYIDELAKREDISLQCLVNNAAIFRRHDIASGTAEWVEQFATNVFGTVELTQACLPLLRASGSASIVNVASTLGLRPTADTSAYSASKAALVSFTQSLAQALGPEKIRVNCICPGLVDTPIHDFHKLPQEKKNAFVKEQLSALQPLGRIGNPEEIANSIYFLGSAEESPWTTGAILSVDGGIHLR